MRRRKPSLRGNTPAVDAARDHAVAEYRDSLLAEAGRRLADHGEHIAGIKSWNTAALIELVVELRTRDRCLYAHLMSQPAGRGTL